VTADDVAAGLNEILSIEPWGMFSLVGFKVGVSRQLLDHPTLQVEELNGNCLVSVLSLLNALLLKHGDQILVAVYDDEPRRHLVRFETRSRKDFGW
jgi:hypothetical protein